MLFPLWIQSTLLCSLLEASSINKLVYSLAGAYLSVQPDQMNNSEHSCTFPSVDDH